MRVFAGCVSELRGFPRQFLQRPGVNAHSWQSREAVGEDGGEHGDGHREPKGALEGSWAVCSSTLGQARLTQARAGQTWRRYCCPAIFLSRFFVQPPAENPSIALLSAMNDPSPQPPSNVGQPFQAAGSGGFPAAASSPPAGPETRKSPSPADRNVCPTAEPSRLVSGFHSRDHLPHLKRAGASYFVTFRLAGTLPGNVLHEFKQERERILAHACAAKRPLTWHEQEELFRWYSTRVDKYLDAGHGDCWLKQPALADLVATALRFHQGQRFDLLAWVVMPNHVHAVVRPFRGCTLSKILQSWKGFTAHEANRILNRVGQPFWQAEAYDHLVRDDLDRDRCCNYISLNPVNAGLCTCPEAWKWSSSFRPTA